MDNISTELIHNYLYPNFEENLSNINKIYKNTGEYIFRRKKHNTNQFYSYLKANGGVSSKLTLTCPAIPIYLLPPDNIINELEKSPKLSLKDGFRTKNWNEILGEFYCEINDIKINTKNKNNTRSKLLRHLEEKNNNTDEYIYSCYNITINKDNSNEIIFTCRHKFDITKKSGNTYSTKTKEFTSELPIYKVSLDLIHSKFLSYY